MKNIDIFCEIIDNFGDIGVIYRFANELYNRYEKNIKIRVILDQTSPLTYIDNTAVNTPVQVIKGVEYMTFSRLEEIKNSVVYPEVIVEGFGCNIPSWYLEGAKSQSSLLINLEYLSSEEWTLDFHLKESLLGAPKLKKFFFMPGLSEKSGGVIIPSKSDEKYALLDYSSFLTKEFLKNRIVGTIFSYEHNFSSLFSSLENLDNESVILCLGEKTQHSIREILKGNILFDEKNSKVAKDSFYFGKFRNTHIIFLPFMNQDRYDALLNLCDFNFVRGEDSFVRGILSKKPFLWHAYLQDDLVHLDKIDGFFKVYSEFFKKNYLGKYDKTLSEYHNLFIEYNHRLSNSTSENREISSEFNLFFSNLDTLKEMNEKFSEYVMKNCNLISKFSDFINKSSNINL